MPNGASTRDQTLGWADASFVSPQAARQPAVRSFATGQDAVVGLYLSELAKITAQADDGATDPELVKSMASLKQKSLGAPRNTTHKPF